MLKNRWQTPRWQCNYLMQATGRLIFKILLSRPQVPELLRNCWAGSWNTRNYKETYFRPSAILESVIGWNFVRTEVRLFPPDSLQWSLLVGRWSLEIGRESASKTQHCTETTAQNRVIAFCAAPLNALQISGRCRGDSDVTEQAARLATRCTLFLTKLKFTYPARWQA